MSRPRINAALLSSVEKERDEAQKMIVEYRKKFDSQRHMLREASRKITELERTKVDQDALMTVIEGKDATIAAHEQTIADLEAKVKDLSQWPAIAHEMARNNTRLTSTVDNMAKAAAGLVPNTVAPR